MAEAKVYYRELRSGDIAHLAANLCEGERMTLVDNYGPDYDAADILAKAVLASDHVEVACVEDDLPVCVIGVVAMSLATGSGYLWMAATPKVFEDSLVLVRESRRYVQRLRGQFADLRGSFDARHPGLAKWMQLLGFQVAKETRIGKRDIPYIDYWT